MSLTLFQILFIKQHNFIVTFKKMKHITFGDFN